MRKPATVPIRRFLDPQLHHEAEGQKIQVVKREIQPMMTIEDVALYLQMSEHMIRKYVYLRILPHVKFGRHVRFRLSDIEKYADENLRSEA